MPKEREWGKSMRGGIIPPLVGGKGGFGFIVMEPGLTVEPRRINGSLLRLLKAE